MVQEREAQRVAKGYGFGKGLATQSLIRSEIGPSIIRGSTNTIIVDVAGHNAGPADMKKAPMLLQHARTRVGGFHTTGSRFGVGRVWFGVVWSVLCSSLACVDAKNYRRSRSHFLVLRLTGRRAPVADAALQTCSCSCSNTTSTEHRRLRLIARRSRYARGACGPPRSLGCLLRGERYRVDGRAGTWTSRVAGAIDASAPALGCRSLPGEDYSLLRRARHRLRWDVWRTSEDVLVGAAGQSMGRRQRNVQAMLPSRQTPK